MKVYTIGFTQTTAKEFFERLKEAGIKRLMGSNNQRGRVPYSRLAWA